MADAAAGTQDPNKTGAAFVPPDNEMDDDFAHPTVETDEAGTPFISGHPMSEAFPEEGETPEQKAAREQAEAEAAAAAKPQEFTPKHKTWEETDKAREEAERTMTQAKMEAAEERKARERLEVELAELRAKPKEEKPEVKPPTDDERLAKITEATKVANRAVLPKLRALDPADEDYEEQYSALMTEVNAATIKALLESGISTASLSKEEVGQMVQEQLAAERASRVAEAKQTEGERAWKAAVDLASKAGLNMADEDSADYIIFDKMSRKMPAELTTPEATLQAQVDWVVGEVRKRTGQVVQTQQEREAAALKLQKENAVLGRGGNTQKPRTKQSDTDPGHLDDDFEEAKQARKIT